MTGSRAGLRRSRPVAVRRATRRAAAAGTWGRPRDGVTHGTLELDVTDLERWCAAQAGVGVVHVVGAALARGLRVAPDVNAHVRFGRVRLREAVDVGYVVDIGRGADMGCAVVRGADLHDPRQHARQVFAAARSLRRGRDADFGRARALARAIPQPLLGLGMRLSGFIAGGLGRRVPLLRLPAHPFGSVMVSSVAAWGVHLALPPLIPFADLGMVVVVGAVAERPWVLDGDVVPRRVAQLGLSFDHRIADGAQIAALLATAREALERPWEVWPHLGGAPAG
ncbi:MAG: 2-oxo acid dehydrogenase subunit E2 [Miltoncostaeaceae bacterium]